MLDPSAPILIVDDFVTMRRIIRKALRQLGHTNTEEACDGREALSKLKQAPFAFIVSDWNMPVMSGIELLRAVRADPCLRHIPFLMVTAEATRENVSEAVEAGVSSYIVKPFAAETLRLKMESIFPEDAAL